MRTTEIMKKEADDQSAHWQNKYFSVKPEMLPLASEPSGGVR